MLARPLSRRAFALGVAVCGTVVAAFLLARRSGPAPHEDETLALFVGRDSLGGMLGTVLGDRGGAPLHYLVSWVVVHAGGGLAELRLASILFAVASVPALALLAARLADRGAALAATAFACASWVFLFHGVFGRMYSLFLLLSTLSFVALLRAVERNGRGRWVLWALAALATLAAHPYGALVLASQAALVLHARTRVGIAALAAVVVAAMPLWYSDIVLASRFDSGAEEPKSAGGYLREVVGDLSSGYLPGLLLVALLVAVGLMRLPRRSAVVAGLVLATPLAAILLAEFAEEASPESRHLIFVLPFVGVAAAGGLPRRLWLALPLLVTVVALELAWAWDRTPELFEGEPAARVEAREKAAGWLAATSRSDDVLFGYHPLYARAWELNAGFSRTVVPRADVDLALDALLEEDEPLGRGVFVLEPKRPAAPPPAFTTASFGPFLVLRSRAAARTPQRYLGLAQDAFALGVSLGDADAQVNLETAQIAAGRLASS